MQEDVPPQASSSHMMKTTKRGRPFLKARFPFPSPCLFLHLALRTPSTFSQLSLFLYNLQHTSNSFDLSQIPSPRASPDFLSTNFSVVYPVPPSLVMKLPQTSLPSSSRNPIVGQTLENPHE
jgi:hypothetical protein